MEFNAMQRTAIEHPDQHILVLAGAGTGKTRTIIGRAHHLMERGVPPCRILLLTFTRRAALEMMGRLRAMSEGQAQEMQAGTFHHFCLHAMRQMPALFGLLDATIIDGEDQRHLMRMSRAEVDLKMEVFPKSPELSSLYSYARNTDQPLEAYLERYTTLSPQGIELALEVFARYEERKAQNHYLDYDDILSQFADTLARNPEAADRMRRMFDHILVDEMQDTNPLQWKILERMRDPGYLFCVGDDAQSIYAFRGADFRNVHRFKKRIPEGKVLRLEQNYRSTQAILNVANWLLAESNLNYDKHLSAVRGEGQRPCLYDFSSETDEAEWVTDDLVSRHHQGADWGDHMVITRTAYAARAVEAMMVERKIPYYFVGGVSLLEAAHVKDVLSLARAAGSHVDELSWTRFLSLMPGIGAVRSSQMFQVIRARATMEEALTALEQHLKPEDRKRILTCIRDVQACWEDASQVLETATYCLESILSSKYKEWDARRRDLDLLIQLAQPYADTITFLETYALDPMTASMASRARDEDAVPLITVHSAKGTEADVCYLIRVQPGMYPHKRSLQDEDAIEEERRVLYVAMTRARDELIMTRSLSQAGQWTFYGDAEQPSAQEAYFLRHFPKGHVQYDFKTTSRGYGSRGRFKTTRYRY